MIATSTKIRMSWNHLIFFHIFESNTFIFSLSLISIIWDTINATRGSRWRIVSKETGICSITLASWGRFVESIYTACRASSRDTASWRSSGWPVWVIFEFFQLSEYFVELSLSFLLLRVSLRNYESPFLINEIWSTNAPANRAINTIPLSLEVRLDLF